MLYNKDKEYTLKYIDINGQQQELKYTPEKDMSVPEIITMLQNKDKNFYKLLKEVNSKKEEDKMLKESYEPLDDDIQMEIYEMIVGGYYSNQTQEENIENTIMEIEEEYPELKDKMEDVRFYVEQKVPEVYEEKDEENEEDLEESNAGNCTYEQLNKQAKFTESIDNGMQDLEAISVLDEDKEVEDYFKVISKQESLIESIPITNNDLRDKYNEYITEIDPGTTMSFEEFKQSYIDTVKPDGESFELVESIEELKGTGEDQTQTQEDVEQAVSEVENPTEEDKFAVEIANSNIEVLIADEQQAIDGYKAFLTQAKKTVLPSLYEVLEKEINEIIADEEDHINILNIIKENLNTIEAPIEENKETVLTENVTVEDIFNELDIDIDSPAAEYEWDTVQEYLDSNPDITLEQAVKDIEEYFETGLL